MSHWGSFLVETHFSTFLLWKWKGGRNSSCTCHAFKRLLLPWVFDSSGGGGKGDVFQIWHVGCWTGNLLLPPHLRPLSGVIPNICVELCAFFCFYPSSSLWLSHPSPCLPNIRASQPACCWEAFLFRLLNFPSSRRFLTGSYTSVPLFLLNSLPGLCAGGMREQRRAVRNHCAGCLTLPYDVFPSSPQLNIAVHFLCRKSEN